LLYFKSLVSTTFAFIIALLIIPSILYSGSDNKIFLAMAEDTLSPSSPIHLAFVGNTLSWTATATNIDGSPLEDLEGYIVYYGTESKKYKVSHDVKNVTTYKIDDLIDWKTYYFAVTAYDTSGNESPYSEEISAKKIPSQHTLNVKIDGTHTGIVTSSAEGINCGSDCDEVYYAGTVIILIAKPDTGSVFEGWSGGGCSGKGQCVLTINADTTVTATFNTKETKEVKETKEETKKETKEETKKETKEETKKETKEESPQPQKPSEEPLAVIFTVQVGAFKNASYAETRMAWLKEKGYSAYITLSGSKERGRLYKVCTGKFAEREKAKTLSEKIRNSEGLQTFVTTLQP
jgi:cell division septation protein DedD